MGDCISSKNCFSAVSDKNIQYSYNIKQKTTTCKYNKYSYKQTSATDTVTSNIMLMLLCSAVTI